MVDVINYGVTSKLGTHQASDIALESSLGDSKVLPKSNIIINQIQYPYHAY